MYCNGPDGIQELIIDGNRKGGAFLILSKHPSEITKNDTVLFAPLEKIRRSAGSFDQFLSELCEFSKNRNIEFLRHFRSEDEGRLKKLLRVVDLRPNICGVGLNLNALLEDLDNA
jgi:predicted CopG family antitoxin